METSFRPQRAQCVLTRPLDLSETRLIGEVVGSVPVGIIYNATPENHHVFRVQDVEGKAVIDIFFGNHLDAGREGGA